MSVVPRVIRLDAAPETEIIEIRHNGVLILASSDYGKLSAALRDLGIPNPAPLIRGVRHFHVVELDQAKGDLF
jgi:hypothetical protein